MSRSAHGVINGLPGVPDPGAALHHAPDGAGVESGGTGAPEFAAGSTELFSEAETRALIRIRHELDSLFEANTKKRGVKEAYIQLAERLFAEGGNEDIIALRPTSTRQRSFKYEEEMSWYKDRLVVDPKRRRTGGPDVTAAAASVVGDVDEGGYVVGAAGAAAKPEAAPAASSLPADVQAMLDELVELQKLYANDADVNDTLVRAVAYAMHPKRRRPLLDLWSLSQRQGWSRDVLVLYLKPTVAAYDFPAAAAAAAAGTV